MATMEQNTNQNTRQYQAQVSGVQASSSPTPQIQAVKQIDALSGDIKKLIGGAENFAKAQYQATEFATKMRGSDYLSKVHEGMNSINEYYDNKMRENGGLSSQDYADKREWTNKFVQDSLKNSVVPEDRDDVIFREYVKKAEEARVKQAHSDSVNQVNMHKIEFAQDWNTKVETRYKTDVGGVEIEEVKDTEKSLQVMGVAESNAVAWKPVADFGVSRIEEKSLADYAGKEWSQVVEDTVGNYIYWKDGKYYKKDESMDEIAYQRLIRALESKRGVTGETPRISNTIKDTNSSINVYTPPAKILQAKNDSEVQLKEIQAIADFSKCAGNTCTQYEEARQAYNDIEMKYKQASFLEADFNRYYENPLATLSDSEFDYDVYNPNGLSKTKKYATVTREQKAEYISTKMLELYETSIKNGDSAKASGALNALARLSVKDNYRGKEYTRIQSFITDNTQIATKVDNANSSGELFAVLDSTIGFKAVTQTDAPHLRANIINETKQYYNEQIANMEKGLKDSNGKEMTEQSILRDTKLLYRFKAREAFQRSLRENQRSVAGRTLGMSESEAQGDAMDKLVSGEIFGWKVGETRFASGSLDVVLGVGMDNGIDNRDGLVSFSQQRMVVMDSSYLPVWGTSTAMYNTVGNNSTFSDKKFKKNVEEIMKYEIGQFQSTKNVDFGDIVDDSHIRFSQQRIFDSRTNGMTVLTIGEVLDSSGSVLHTVVMEPEDIRAGVTSAKQEEVKSRFE